MSNLEQAADVIDNASDCVFLTGAGMSRAAGVPTFRDDDGMWRQPEYKAWSQRQTFDANPSDWYEIFWGFYMKRRQLAPSVAHYALKDLVEAEAVSNVITQNVDGFDLESGIPASKLHEIHGHDRQLNCTVCPEHVPTTDWLDNHSRNWQTVLPVCSQDHILKPNILLFGPDSIDQLQSIHERAYETIEQADALVVAGSSLEIPYVFEWVLEFTQPEKSLVIINPARTVTDEAASLCIRETAEVALPQLLELLVSGC